MSAKNLTTDSSSGQLGIRSRMQFTGRLDVQAKGQEWSLYLYMGRLIWATGGSHAVRRWRRNLAQYCSHIDPSTLSLQENSQLQCWDYYTLIDLVKRQQVTREQAVAFVQATVLDVLFDVIQREETGVVIFNSDAQDVLARSLVLVNAEHALQQMQAIWNDWCGLGLADRSPDSAPVLRRPDQLQQYVSEKVYHTLVTLVDGKRSLRDLAVLMKQDLLSLMRMLVPFLRKGLISLTTIPDLPSPVTIAPSTHSTPTALPTSVSKIQSASVTAPLIACIDDSQRECQIMEQILTQAGYRFIEIRDSVQALPILIEQKPSLIFLDLVMPVANGYEICAQIRRVSLFKDTPVVILTSNDGIIDRVRAKVVGSSGFLAKPVEADKVLAIAQRYLSRKP